MGRYPYQASIWDNNSFKCGGSVITERFILTAAHCIYKRSANTMTVVVGTNYLKHNGDIYNVDKLIWHNGYCYKLIINDIGLIRVNKKIVLSETVQPIRLAPVFDIPSGEVAVVTGWGRLSDEGPIPSTLHELYTIVVSQESCQKIFPEVDDKKICTLTENNTSACYVRTTSRIFT
ncbi:chymotrypsin-2-like [Hylaeus anthracinus]|uniref:chymotrypsin-2-like n=1 Tax=Hylaeus anthracinus TaxID=313031 RepID=UPI0023B9A1F4|nr:chymotrypsin-2-like [Hylaeus anthracinus]